MIIEKIEIESFASHSNTEIELSDGVNLIEGDNESGKSSLADFIKFVLYGAAGKASDGHLAERKRVMNFNSSYMAGALCVRCGERRLRITRNTAVSGSVRESVRTRISVIDRDTGEDIYDGSEPGVMLLGIPEELFCSSAYLSQRQGNAVGASVNEAISNILFSGDERMSADRAIERIE
ncbi:MAG: AAA family ATPase, partial [Clostridia bacterium]|nr:AAA family ATPase [Clostridia bacterium]